MYPNLLFPRYLLGQMYYESNQIEEAFITLNALLKINPKIQNNNTETIKIASEKLLQKIEQLKIIN